MAYKIDADKCIGCTACARQCPVKAISGERQQTHVIDPEYCINCGLCTQFCAQSAIINQWGAPVKFNKDARKQRKVPDIDTEACTGCWMCVEECPKYVLRISEPLFHGDIRTHAELFDPDNCIGCGKCEKRCPIGAITMEDRETAMRNAADRRGSVTNKKISKGRRIMSTLKKCYYRVFQWIFNIGARCLYWRRPIVTSGPNSVTKIPELLKERNVTKPIIVTGPSIGKKLAPRVTEALDAAGIPYFMFANVEANPSVNTVNTIQKLYFENKCDGFIAIGGGSPMDAAKGAAARVVRPRTPVGKMAGLLRVMRRIPPFIAVPTTAGTGSETTIAAVITDTDTHHKYALMDLHLIPRYAVLDPEMTRGLPPKITAATGMDALTHAVEAYCCWTYNTKESLRDAEEATVAIFKYLKRAYDNGDDMEARNEMLIASYKAGFAFTRAGVGNVHAIAHTLGGLYNTPHGLANAVILPIVLEDYGPAVYKKLARLSELTGTCTSGTEEEKAKAFIKEIRAMNTYFEHPTGFDFIQEKDIPQMIKWALHEANPTYPVPVVYDEERCNKVIHRIINEA